MGLIHPTSLERWREWRRLGRPGRRIAGAIASRRTARPPETGLRLHSREGEGPGRVLIVADPAGPRELRDLLAPLPYLHAAVDVLTPADVELPGIDPVGWEVTDVDRPGHTLLDRGVTAILSVGQQSEAGSLAHRWASRVGVPGFVLQTDALTPYSAPLPEETTLLAWSAADGEFWSSGRDDVVVRPIGAQGLWQAHHEAIHEAVAAQGRAVFLGHLSDEALPRRLSARAAVSFCTRHGAGYRPHPDDTDARSRLTHRLLRRRGIEFAPQDDDEAVTPVVAVRSVELLAAAARGVPAWAHAPDPPTWLREYWERYGMRRYGGPEPTPAPQLPDVEPAAALAEILESDG